MPQDSSSESPVADRQSADVPNQAANMEPAEGSRENAGGISNRPLEQERENQERRAEEDARRDDADLDPVMPTGDATLNTKI